jgi:MOSC domain-containing protein YiiM
MRGVQSVHAVPGKGLEGDRYFSGEGCFSQNPGSGRDVTLIEAEALEALERELNLVVGSGETRRNIITRGVALNHLVDREFIVGEVRLRGMRLCEPCNGLVEITGKPSILPGLIHRGGLRCDILSEGVISVGDAVGFAE